MFISHGAPGARNSLQHKTKPSVPFLPPPNLHYSLKDLVHLLLNLRLRRPPKIVDGHPKPDVLVAVLLPQVGGELLKARGVTDELLHGQSPPLDPFLSRNVDTAILGVRRARLRVGIELQRAVYLPEGQVFRHPGIRWLRSRYQGVVLGVGLHVLDHAL